MITQLKGSDSFLTEITAGIPRDNPLGAKIWLSTASPEYNSKTRLEALKFVMNTTIGSTVSNELFLQKNVGNSYIQWIDNSLTKFNNIGFINGSDNNLNQDSLNDIVGLCSSVEDYLSTYINHM